MTNKETIIKELQENYGLDDEFFGRYSPLIDSLVQAINDKDDSENDIREELQECIKDYIDYTEPNNQ